VDTCAAEFKAKTPYYYSTFEAEIETPTGKDMFIMKVLFPIKRKYRFGFRAKSNWARN
jgi:hypothetical protein